ncbi:MAG: wax ester/triacylglycerol synthase domain-containing protein [Ilumatobacteraceae bacterium]
MSAASGPMLRFERAMSDAEALMWRLEKDPHLSSTFSNVTVLDRPLDMGRLLRRLERAVYAVPRLHQRVQPAPANLTPPVWVDDPNFDLHHHVRHIALPAPGTMRQLLDLASLLTADAFDRTRPLWQFHVVEGLEGGRGALIEKFHHTLVDGEAGVQLSLQFLDLDRDPPEPPPLDPELIAAARAAESEHAPLDVLREMVAGSVRMPLGMLRQVRDLVGDPGSIPDAGAAAVDTAKAVLHQLAESDAAKSPLWTSRSLRRRMEVLRAPFGPTRDAAKRLGGTLNTAFLACAADAAGRYHRALDAPVTELRASMAISTRTGDSGSNAFSLARMLVPTAEMTVRERFTAIRDAADVARSTGMSASLDALAAFTGTLPTSLITRVARQQAQTVDFATSNVRGAPVPLYVAGARLLQNYPLGPLGGVAFNLTLLSYDHSLDMGVNIDAAAVTEPALLQECLQDAFREFADAE